MRVVMLGGGHGGEAVHIDRLTRYLSQIDNIELHLITENKEFKKDRLNLHLLRRISNLPFVFTTPIDTMFLIHKILKINPDIVHAHGIFPYRYSIAAFLVRNKFPTLISLHGLITEDFKYHKGLNLLFSKFIGKPLEKHIVSRIPYIICPPALKRLIRSMSSSKIYAISSGIDFADPKDIQPLNSIEHPCLLFVGFLRRTKGVDILLKATSLIKKKAPNVHTYIIGTGPQEAELRRLVKELRLNENVKFLGFISESEKYSYYKSADVCVFPSLYYEPFGIVVLEAMACRKPVVASNVGGLPFLVEDGKTGVLFERGNFEDLAEKVITLVKNKDLREEMGEAGCKRAKKFSWEKVAKRTVKVYAEMLKNNEEARHKL